jgi:hypothetical protein
VPVDAICGAPASPACGEVALDVATVDDEEDEVADVAALDVDGAALALAIDEAVAPDGAG